MFAKQLVNKIAVVQFWIHQVTTPILLIALALMLRGNADIEPVVGIMSAVVGVSVLLFVYNVLRNLSTAK
jgi:multisubunit Na+/H+ antiporter MnhB subunit